MGIAGYAHEAERGRMQPSLEFRGSILVVEDEPAIRLVVAEVLRDDGYEVREACDGIEGLRALEEWTPDLVVLDVTMPRLDGRGFRREQRALVGPAANVPVILVTGAHLTEQVLAEFEAESLLKKPFELDELVALVASLVPGREEG